MTTEDKKVEASDLDLLDDEYTHAGCIYCYPPNSMDSLDKYIGICGKEAIVHEPEPGRGPMDVPSNPCPKCLVIAQSGALFHCGHHG